MRKPVGIKMREFETRAVEMNAYLEYFPNGKLDDNGVPLGFVATQKLDEDELADLMELGTPNKWQKEMISHALVEFCERIETIEGMEAERSPNHHQTKTTTRKRRSRFQRLTKGLNGMPKAILVMIRTRFVHCMVLAIATMNARSSSPLELT